MPHRRYKIFLCLVAFGQVVGMSLLFLGMVGNLDSALSTTNDKEPSSKDKTTEDVVVDVEPLEDLGKLPKKVVLMVVDALRVDMMTRNNFPFLLNSLINNNKKTGVLLYNVTVDSPTVTLPRVKVKYLMNR
jgi:hypothetical protein